MVINYAIRSKRIVVVRKLIIKACENPTVTGIQEIYGWIQHINMYSNAFHGYSGTLFNCKVWFKHLIC